MVAVTSVEHADIPLATAFGLEGKGANTRLGDEGRGGVGERTPWQTLVWHMLDTTERRGVIRVFSLFIRLSGN